MSWLYVPETSSPCAQESAGSSLASPSPSTIGERLRAASATWRGKHQPPQAWSRRWEKGGFIRLLSGPTLPPSILDRGVASFISSLRETPARTIRSPEPAPEPVESASSPPRWSASPPAAGLILCSERTSRGTPMDSSLPLSRVFGGWATALRQEYSARPKPATPCGASDCSSWPSATVLDSTNTRNSTANRSNPNSTHSVGDTLCDAVMMWAAPRTITGGAESGERKKELGRTESGGGDLQAQATEWRAPGAADSSRDQLPNFVEFCFHPPSSPARPIAGGSTCSTDGPNTNQPSQKRKLNPIFVEALMRWPTGLSGFERPETAWIRWCLLMPSFLSALCSSVTDEPAQGSLL